VAFTDSDSQFVQMRDFYTSMKKRLGAFKERATLSYRLAGDSGSITQDVPAYVVPMLVGGCQKVDKP